MKKEGENEQTGVAKNTRQRRKRKRSRLACAGRERDRDRLRRGKTGETRRKRVEEGWKRCRREKDRDARGWIEVEPGDASSTLVFRVLGHWWRENDSTEGNNILNRVWEGVHFLKILAKDWLHFRITIIRGSGRLGTGHTRKRRSAVLAEKFYRGEVTRRASYSHR